MDNKLDDDDHYILLTVFCFLTLPPIVLGLITYINVTYDLNYTFMEPISKVYMYIVGSALTISALNVIYNGLKNQDNNFL